MEVIMQYMFRTSIKQKKLQLGKIILIPLMNREKSKEEKCPLCGTSEVVLRQNIPIKISQSDMLHDDPRSSN
ncbi:Hypothetical protein CINCED_3A022592 [Cinara cedri]|uniref:Uncharacterized protein n=1 Tax=Cinara cedri TaxID=506608 RepID=A0A5E4NSX1_9HEMI|nr:Hypothetical protein CINCED_3A022592 [Cinara cedri]